jgi:hypothetical protein
MRTRALSSSLLLIAGLAAGAASGQTRWPSLEEQLARDRVPAGSALAKLIAQNQDFQLLHPGEARDEAGVPPWLRVLWRKKHPESEFSPVTGGYPLVIKEIHEWMVHHPDLPAREPETGAAAAASKAASLGSDLDISGARGNAESDIRINPWDPDRIISSANNLTFGTGMAVFYSHDGGTTWKQTTLIPFPEDEFLSDPAMEWTSDGTAWATAIGVDTGELILRLRVYRSSDGGATWVQDATISGGQEEADRQMTWADHSAASPFKDHFYVIWHNGPRIYVNRRKANGTWGGPVQVSGSETAFGIGSDVKTNSAGHVFAFWPDVARRKINFSKSTDGGATFSKPISVASTFDSFMVPIPAQSRRGAPIYVSAGAYKSGRKNLVYAVWTDITGVVPGCKNALNEPRENVASECKTRIWFSRSTNGGVRWTKARMLNDAATKNDQFMPALAVDETTGALGLIYYDTAGEERTKTNLWYQSSFNDGVTWSAPVRVTSAASDLHDYNSFQYGDYNSLSGIAGTFFPSWTDRRGTGLSAVWTVKISDRKDAKCRTTELFAEGFASAAASVAVPERATETRLSFWHRRRFASGLNAGSLEVSVDGGPATAVPATAIVSGAGAAASGEEALFKGMDASPVNTVVDLDSVCGAAGCAGRTLRLFFSAGDLPAEKPDRWLLDDVVVTACMR